MRVWVTGVYRVAWRFPYARWWAHPRTHLLAEIVAALRRWRWSGYCHRMIAPNGNADAVQRNYALMLWKSVPWYAHRCLGQLAR
jgi:hypothetical protein